MAEESIPPPRHVVEIDERWIAEWVAFGMKQLRTYLDKHAQFAEYLEQHPDHEGAP